MLKRFSVKRMALKKKNPAAVALGRLGGRKSGKARMQKLTPEKRSEVARKAALARWRKRQ
jgi:predicted KAP-like P-loop ATPase